MKRKELTNRVNQRLDGRRYSWDQMKYEFDDAITEINNKMQTTFPMMSEILLDDESQYKSYILTIGDNNVKVLFKTKIDMDDYILENTLSTDKYNTRTLDVFPQQYIRGIVIPFVVMRMLQREDEYGNLQSTMNQEFLTGINNMFSQYYNDVPDYYVAIDGEMESYSKHGHRNPYQLKEDYKNGPLD